MNLSPGISLLCWLNSDTAFKYEVCLGAAEHRLCLLVSNPGIWVIGSVLSSDLLSSSAAQHCSSCESVQRGSRRVRRLLANYADAAVRNLAPCLMSGYSTAERQSDFFFSHSLSLCRLHTCNVFKRLPIGIFLEQKNKQSYSGPRASMFWCCCYLHIIFVDQLHKWVYTSEPVLVLTHKNKQKCFSSR